MKYYAILVAGGVGKRAKSDMPKQFLLLNNKPVLMHTIEAFSKSEYKPEIIISLHPDYHVYWNSLCEKQPFSIPYTLVPGGSNRFESVKNALNIIPDRTIVAIHDAVRPIIGKNIIDQSFKIAEEKGNAVTAIKSRDSVRQTIGLGSKALDRETIFLVQTPQTFRSEIIKMAYMQPFTPEFTDDASVLEKSGVIINLIEGDSENLKITYPEDIFIASYFLSKKNPA